MPNVYLLEWKWVRGQQPREEYTSILNAFIDKKDSYYSIHQIGKSQSYIYFIFCVITSTGIVYTPDAFLRIVRCLFYLQLRWEWERASP